MDDHELISELGINPAWLGVNGHDEIRQLDVDIQTLEETIRFLNHSKRYSFVERKLLKNLIKIQENKMQTRSTLSVNSFLQDCGEDPVSSFEEPTIMNETPSINIEAKIELIEESTSASLEEIDRDEQSNTLKGQQSLHWTPHRDDKFDGKFLSNISKRFSFPYATGPWKLLKSYRHLFNPNN